ncbi:hypothetical protein nbrc107697_09980 [Gordonia crocea]|uniref:Uncharacterized protein n=1 Tax=Gordonia crocea TaxID=589162 RepID=A0A7I9UVD7_9ACTN|nr:hypothetical protein nbrc107697_09980 [Gordonia crocea]
MLGEEFLRLVFEEVHRFTIPIGARHLGCDTGDTSDFKPRPNEAFARLPIAYVRTHCVPWFAHRYHVWKLSLTSKNVGRLLDLTPRLRYLRWGAKSRIGYEDRVK